MPLERRLVSPVSAAYVRQACVFALFSATLACSGEDGTTPLGDAPTGAGGAASSVTSSTATSSSGPATTAAASVGSGSVASSTGTHATTSASPATSGGSGETGGQSSGAVGGSSDTATTAASTGTGGLGVVSSGQTSSAGSTSTSGGGAGTQGATSGGDGGCSPLEMLEALAPSDPDLAEDFAEYVAEELGTMSCEASGRGGARTINQTIFVPPNSVYDGQGETLTADAATMNCDLSEGEQAESQRPYFLLAPGASLKNVTLAYPGCEGIHMMGDNVLENITWLDAGEDAASVRSYFPGGDITISGSEGHHAADKMFQFNAPCNVLIQDFVGSDMGKLVRQNGGTEFELRIDLNNVTVTDCVSAVVQSDSPLCFVRHHALSYTFTGSGDKSDRVFRDIPPENVTEY